MIINHKKMPFLSFPICNFSRDDDHCSSLQGHREVEPSGSQLGEIIMKALY